MRSHLPPHTRKPGRDVWTAAGLCLVLFLFRSKVCLFEFGEHCNHAVSIY